MENILVGLGLTHNESRVYITLINQGSLSAGKLTSKCGIHRRSVYDALDRLIEKGVVAYIKVNNIKIYSATNPSSLLDILKKKEEEVNQILPELNKVYNKTKAKKETVFYRGKEGIKYIFEDQIKEKKEVLIMGGSSTYVYEVLKYYLPHYERERLAHNINVKIIFDTKEKLDIPLSEIRYSKHSLGPSAINIYANKVAIIVWSEAPYAILIDDNDVADSYRKHFDLMWDISKNK